jgi:hypothetical protein
MVEGGDAASRALSTTNTNALDTRRQRPMQPLFLQQTA